MSLGDFGARFKQVKAVGNEPTKPYDFSESYRLRTRILGVLIRDARISAARTPEDCARLLAISPETVERWELGDEAPDLAQLELLSYYLEIPVSHFWGQEAINRDPTSRSTSQTEYMSLRHRMIGALLRQAREAAGWTLDYMVTATGIPAEQLTAYEMGETAIPMSELYVLSSQVNKNMDYFIEATGYVGELLRIREEWKKFTGLDEDVRHFAANPVNLAFIRIAMMFRDMPTDQLRKVAAGLADITM